MLDPRFAEHFAKPQNVGDLADASGRSVVENPVCGDVLRVAVKLGAGKVTDVRWRCDGCAASIAAASAGSELLIGRAAVSADEIDAALGGLPQLKKHGADLAAEGLMAAVRDHEKRGLR